MSHERHGAKQPHRFDPARAAILDDAARFAYVPVDALVAMLDIPVGGLLVDFGTGTGLYACAIAARRPDVRVVALDEQAQMLEHTRAAIERSGLGNVEPATPQMLPALAGRADRVLALNVLHELGNRALDEVRSLLAAAGRAVFVDWNADVHRDIGPPSDHVYGAAQAAERLSAAAFTIVDRGLLRYHHVFVVTAA